MFRIAEEYTKTIKKNPDEQYFFILEKIDFQNFKNFKNFKNPNFEKKSEKSKFGKIENFKIIRFSQISTFQIFSQNLDFEILKIVFF